MLKLWIQVPDVGKSPIRSIVEFIDSKSWNFRARCKPYTVKIRKRWVKIFTGGQRPRAESKPHKEWWELAFFQKDRTDELSECGHDQISETRSRFALADEDHQRERNHLAKVEFTQNRRRKHRATSKSFRTLSFGIRVSQGLGSLKNYRFWYQLSHRGD